MKTQLTGEQGWESLRAAAAKIYDENGDKMVVKFCANKYVLATAEQANVRWYAGFIDEAAAAFFMNTDGVGRKYYSLIIDPLLRACIVKCSTTGENETVYIDEKLITIL